MWSKNASPDYLKSGEGLVRDVYVCPWHELQIGPGQLLKVSKPLYRFNYAGDY